MTLDRIFGENRAEGCAYPQKNKNARPDPTRAGQALSLGQSRTGLKAETAYFNVVTARRFLAQAVSLEAGSSGRSLP